MNAPRSGEGKEEMMGEWLAISEWERCVDMMRAGIVFEIRNAEGLSMFTPCVQPLPDMPFDWTLPPVEFRAVVEAPPEHSEPLPPPRS